MSPNETPEGSVAQQTYYRLILPVLFPRTTCVSLGVYLKRHFFQVETWQILIDSSAYSWVDLDLQPTGSTVPVAATTRRVTQEEREKADKVEDKV